MQWVFLATAIVTEVSATLSLRMAVNGAPRWYAPMLIGYVAAFGSLSLALNEGVGLGFAYGIWSAAGVAITAVASRLLFDERLSPVMGAGIFVIGAGVLCIELGASH
jgi:small multidrug resistance pump